MDFMSHGLWGGIAFGRKNRRAFLWAFAFGVMPDILSFGVFSSMHSLGLASGPDWSQGHPPMSEVPAYVHSLYNITHSLFVFALAFVVVFLFTKKIFWPMFAWLLHILMDIPTHSTRFFATPFLWPISDYKFNGVAWSHPYIFYPDIAILIVLYILFFYSKRKRSK